MSEYLQAAQAIGVSLRQVIPHPPTGLLIPLRLGSHIMGFFKPLTAASCDQESTVATMVGCDISVQGVGVQWTLDQVGEQVTL